MNSWSQNLHNQNENSYTIKSRTGNMESMNFHNAVRLIIEGISLTFKRKEQFHRGQHTRVAELHANETEYEVRGENIILILPLTSYLNLCTSAAILKNLIHS